MSRTLRPFWLYLAGALVAVVCAAGCVLAAISPQNPLRGKDDDPALRQWLLDNDADSAEWYPHLKAVHWAGDTLTADTNYDSGVQFEPFYICRVLWYKAGVGMSPPPRDMGKWKYVAVRSVDYKVMAQRGPLDTDCR